MREASTNLSQKETVRADQVIWVVEDGKTVALYGPVLVLVIGIVISEAVERLCWRGLRLTDLARPPFIGC
jgi:hypothetical protein